MLIECLNVKNYQSIGSWFFNLHTGINLIGPMPNEHQLSFINACKLIDDLFSCELLEFNNFSDELKSKLLALLQDYHNAQSIAPAPTLHTTLAPIYSSSLASSLPKANTCAPLAEQSSNQEPEQDSKCEQEHELECKCNCDCEHDCVDMPMQEQELLQRPNNKDDCEYANSEQVSFSSELKNKAGELILALQPKLVFKLSAPFEWDAFSSCDSLIIEISLSDKNSGHDRFSDEKAHTDESINTENQAFLANHEMAYRCMFNDPRVVSHKILSKSNISEFCGFGALFNHDSRSVGQNQFKQDDVSLCKSLIRQLDLSTKVRVWASAANNNEAFALKEEQVITVCAMIKLMAKVSLLKDISHSSEHLHSFKLFQSDFARASWPKLSQYESSNYLALNQLAQCTESQNDKVEYDQAVKEIALAIIEQYGDKLILPKQTDFISFNAPCSIITQEDNARLEHFAYDWAYHLISLEACFSSYNYPFNSFKELAIAKAVKIANAFMEVSEAFTSYNIADPKSSNSLCQELIFCSQLETFKYFDIAHWCLIKPEGLYGEALQSLLPQNNSECTDCAEEAQAIFKKLAEKINSHKSSWWAQKMAERYALLNKGSGSNDGHDAPAPMPEPMLAPSSVTTASAPVNESACMTASESDSATVPAFEYASSNVTSPAYVPKPEHADTDATCNFSLSRLRLNKYVSYSFTNTSKMVEECSAFYVYLIEHTNLLVSQFVILVEGLSDVLIFEAVAKRLGYDLKALGIAVVPFVSNGLLRYLDLLELLEIDYLVVTDSDSGGKNTYAELMPNPSNKLLSISNFMQVAAFNNLSANSPINRILNEVAPNTSLQAIKQVLHNSNIEGSWDRNGRVSYFLTLPDKDLEFHLLNNGCALNIISHCFLPCISANIDKFAQKCSNAAYNKFLGAIQDQIANLDSEYKGKIEQLQNDISKFLSSVCRVTTLATADATSTATIATATAGTAITTAADAIAQSSENAISTLIRECLGSNNNQLTISSVIATYYLYQRSQGKILCSFFRLAYLYALKEEKNIDQTKVDQVFKALSKDQVENYEWPDDKLICINFFKMPLNIALESIIFVLKMVEFCKHENVFGSCCSFNQSEVVLFIGDLISTKREQFLGFIQNKETTKKYATVNQPIEKRRAYSYIHAFITRSNPQISKTEINENEFNLFFKARTNLRRILKAQLASEKASALTQSVENSCKDATADSNMPNDEPLDSRAELFADIRKQLKSFREQIATADSLAVAELNQDTADSNMLNDELLESEDELYADIKKHLESFREETATADSLAEPNQDTAAQPSVKSCVEAAVDSNMPKGDSESYSESQTLMGSTVGSESSDGSNDAKESDGADGYKSTQGIEEQIGDNGYLESLSSFGWCKTDDVGQLLGVLPTDSSNMVAHSLMSYYYLAKEKDPEHVGDAVKFAYLLALSINPICDPLLAKRAVLMLQQGMTHGLKHVEIPLITSGLLEITSLDRNTLYGAMKVLYQTHKLLNDNIAKDGVCDKDIELISYLQRSFVANNKSIANFLAHIGKLHLFEAHHRCPSTEDIATFEVIAELNNNIDLFKDSVFKFEYDNQLALLGRDKLLKHPWYARLLQNEYPADKLSTLLYEAVGCCKLSEVSALIINYAHYMDKVQGTKSEVISTVFFESLLSFNHAWQASSIVASYIDYRRQQDQQDIKCLVPLFNKDAMPLNQFSAGAIFSFVALGICENTIKDNSWLNYCKFLITINHNKLTNLLADEGFRFFINYRANAKQKMAYDLIAKQLTTAVSPIIDYQWDRASLEVLDDINLSDTTLLKDLVDI